LGSGNGGNGLFREFGTPARIATFETKEEGEDLVFKHIGETNCYVSVYAFRNTTEIGKTEYDSAVIETIWFDFDDDNNVTNCLEDVRKLYTDYCLPHNLIPRIYYTGGRGFQLNIDFDELPLPNRLKRKIIRNYILNIKTKYKLKSLDEHCINNSVACLRRMVNTPYINKKTGLKNGRFCIPLNVSEVLSFTMDDIEELSSKPRDLQYAINRSANEKVAVNILHFLCDELEISYTPTNSIHYLIDQIQSKEYPEEIYSNSLDYIKPIRKCVNNLITRCIERGSSGHSENNAMATEMINAGWKDQNIAFVFSSIYEGEDGRKWGWYNSPSTVGYQIHNLRTKGINRFSKNKLMQLNICKGVVCGCGR